MAVRFKIPRTSDVAVAKVFSGVAKDYPIMQVTSATALGGTEIPGALGDGEAWVALLGHKGYLLDFLRMRIGGLIICYFRGGQGETKSPIFDEISLEMSTQQQSPDLTTRMAIQHRLQKELRAFEPDKVLSGTALETNAQFVALQSSVFERLELIAEDVLTKSAEYREALDNRYDEKLAKEAEKAEELRARLQAEHEQREQELRTREHELATKLKEIDDRDNRYVRREIRDRMLEDVKARISAFGVSKTTADKRRPVLYGLLALVLALAMFMFISFEELSWLRTRPDPDRTTLYWLWFRVSLASFGIVGTLLYYLRWQNRWADQHAMSEFQLQQFYIDVNRANWVIESCLEWTKETGQPVPQELVQTISKGLFTNAEPSAEQLVNPADALASALMGTASKLRLKFGDSEVEIDKPGKLAKKEIKLTGSEV